MEEEDCLVLVSLVVEELLPRVSLALMELVEQRVLEEVAGMIQH